MPQSRWTFGHIQSAIRKTIRNEHLLLVGLGLVVGCIAGAAVIVFRETIELIEVSTFGITTNMLARYEITVDTWKLILIPAAGGLIVGLITWKLMPGGQAQGVADVVEA